MESKKTKEIALIGVFISFAIILNIFENYMPLPFVVPGAKLGLSNIITLIAIFILGYREALLILIVRIVLGSIFGGGLSGFMYSFTGGMLSYSSMIVCLKVFKDKISLVGISVTGSFFHSLGQIIVSIIVLENIRMVTYLPALSIASIISGIFTGIAAMAFVNRYNESYKKYLS